MSDERDIYVNGERVAVLGRDAAGRYVHTYLPDAGADCFVSLLMPVRRASYSWPTLHPVYAAALPTGEVRRALDDALVRAGVASAYALLDTHRLRLGRLEVALPGHPPLPEPAAASPGLLTLSDTGPAFRALFEAQFTVPVALPRDASRPLEAIDREAIYRADPADGAELYNEYCALTIARRAGFDVPEAELSADRRLLRLPRFDGLSGARHAVEDFCSLQALAPESRYAGSAERLTSFAAALAPAVARTAVRRELFRRLVLSHLLVDTDRHLMTYAVLSESLGSFKLAPIVGLRTAWERPLDDPALVPALAINGERRFAHKPGTLRRLGAHCALSERETRAIIAWLVSAQQAAEAELLAASDARTRPWLTRLQRVWRAGRDLLEAAH